MGLRPEAAEGWSANEEWLEVEGVVDCTMGAEEPLGGALRLEFLLLALSSSDGQVGVFGAVVFAHAAGSVAA